MKKITIETTDIFLDDKGEGRGKVTISDGYRGAYNYFWGSMGSSLEEFLCRINSDYFADKFCPNNYVFDGKSSVKNIRRFIRTEMTIDLPFYKFMEGQKELREKLKELENCQNANEFVLRCGQIPNELMCLGMDYHEEKEFRSILEGLFGGEVWNFIGEKLSPTYLWLRDIHKELKKELPYGMAA